MRNAMNKAIGVEVQGRVGEGVEEDGESGVAYSQIRKDLIANQEFYTLLYKQEKPKKFLRCEQWLGQLGRKHGFNSM